MNDNQLIDAARELLVRLGAGVNRLTLSGAGVRLTIRREGEISAGALGLALSPLEREIVGSIGLEKLTAKVIAARVHRTCDSAFRTILANLCERQPPVLTSGRAGYRLATAADAEDASPATYGKVEPSTNGYHEPHLNGRLGS
jgi:hypothetical protein